MRRILLPSLLVVSLTWLLSAIPASAQAPGLEGTYSGTLEAGDAKLHIALHLSKNSQGALHATVDSLENGVFAVEATSVSLDAGTLKFEIRSVGVRYEGRVSLDRSSIDGTWNQSGASLPLVFRRDPEAHKPESAKYPVEGLWQGALEAHGLRLRFQLHVFHDPNGELIAALDSLDQFVSGVPAAKVTLKENAFHFEVPTLSSTYDGVLDANKNKIAGEWSQPEIKEKMNFDRSDQPLELRRPQNPVRPFPYREEDVKF